MFMVIATLTEANAPHSHELGLEAGPIKASGGERLQADSSRTVRCNGARGASAT
jgi:hypothetical protein